MTIQLSEFYWYTYLACLVLVVPLYVVYRVTIKK